MKFLVDNQLPAALARFLAASRGVDCQHVLDLNLGGASDAGIWAHACQNDYVVISKDEDFLYLANARPAKASLIWIRLGNRRTKALPETGLSKFADLGRALRPHQPQVRRHFFQHPHRHHFALHGEGHQQQVVAN